MTTLTPTTWAAAKVRFVESFDQAFLMWLQLGRVGALEQEARALFSGPAVEEALHLLRAYKAGALDPHTEAAP